MSPHDQVPARYAMLGGLLGFTSILITGAAMRRLGWMRLDFTRLLGTTFGHDRGRNRALGIGLSLVNGSLIGLAYRAVFRRAHIEPGPGTGAALGLLHGAAAGAAVALAPRFHPRPDEAGLHPPSPTAYGPLTVPGILLEHVVFGSIVGAGLEAGAAQSHPRTNPYSGRSSGR